MFVPGQILARWQQLHPDDVASFSPTVAADCVRQTLNYLRGMFDKQCGFEAAPGQEKNAEKLQPHWQFNFNVRRNYICIGIYQKRVLKKVQKSNWALTAGFTALNLNIPPCSMWCELGLETATKSQKQHLLIEFTCETGTYECVGAHEAEQRPTESDSRRDRHLTHQLNPIQPLLNGVGP